MTSFNAAAPERDVNWGPERTSILAIVALVFGLPCFIPGTGIIASLLAVFALVGISGSKGRIGGTGLAIAALVLGLFGTAVWTAVGYGAIQAASFFKQEIVGPTAAVITEIQNREFDKARFHFAQLSADQLTDERLEAFRTDYMKKFGEFKGAPSSIMEIFSDYSQLGPIMNNLKAPPQGQNFAPLPVRFEKGPVLLMLEFDPNHRRKSTTQNPKPSTDVFSIKNISLVSPRNEVVILIDPKLLPSTSVIELKPGIQIRTDSTPEAAPAEKTPVDSPESPAKEPETTPAKPK